MSKAHLASSPVPYTHCLRLTLSIDNGSVQLLKVTRVAMRALAADPAPPAAGTSGFWFEVTDPNGKVIYHLPLPHSDLDSVEVFDDPQGGAIRRVPRSRGGPRKVELIVPDLPAAAIFTLHGTPRGAQRREPSIALFQHAMDGLRRIATSRSGTATP